MCVVCVCFGVCQRADALRRGKTVVDTVCQCMCVRVLSPQHANGLCLHAVHDRACVRLCVWMCLTRTPSYITYLTLMRGLTYEFTFL